MTKTELEAMTIDELTSLAEQLNAEKTDSKIDLIYNILDAEAIRKAKEELEKPAPKKRGRKSKAEKEAMAAAQASEKKKIGRASCRERV